MKKISLKTAYHTAGDMKHAVTAQRCINLREVGRDLEVVRSLHEIGKLPVGHRLLHADFRDDIGHFLSICGDCIYLWAIRRQGSDEFEELLTPICRIDAEPCRCLSHGEFVVISTSRGLRFLRYHRGNYVLLDMQRAVPQICFETAESRVRTEIMPELKFVSPVASWSGQLSGDNQELVCNRQLAAYRRIVDAAHRNGEFLQPVLARYIVRLWDDSVLYASAPVLLGNGVQGGDSSVGATVAGASGGYVGVASAQFTASVYGIGYDVCSGIDESWSGLVKSVEIAVAMMPEPVNGECTANLDHPDINTRNLTATLRLYPFENLVAGMVAADNWTVIATLNPSALRSGSRKVIYHYDLGGSRRVSAAHLAAAVDAWHALYVPTAMEVSAAGLHLGGGEIINRALWNPSQWFAGRIANTPCTVAVRVDTAEGVLCKEFALPYMPKQLSPLLAVPIFGAEAIEVHVSGGGSSFGASFALSTAGAEGYSYYISPRMQPVQLPEDGGSFVPSESTVGEVSQANRILTMMPGNPFSVRYDVNVGNSAIIDISVAKSPVTSGVFSHLPLYVFTTNGVFAASYEPAKSAAAVPRLIASLVAGSRAAVRGARCCVVAPSGVWFVASGILYRISGTRCAAVCYRCNSDAIVYDALHDEIVGVSGTGDLRVYSECGRYYDLGCTGVMRIFAGADGLFAIASDGTLLENRDDNGVIPILLRSRQVEMDEVLNCITWSVYGRNLDLWLRVYSGADEDRGGVPLLLESYYMQGDFSAPVTVTSFLPYFSEISFEINGEASAGTVIKPIVINK